MLTIEAMKMETGLYADRAGTVKALHVQPGAQVDAKDLLVELERPDRRASAIASIRVWSTAVMAPRMRTPDRRVRQVQPGSTRRAT